MKKIEFKRHHWTNYYSNSWKSVLILLLIALLVAFTGYGYARWGDNEVLAKEAIDKTVQLENENIVLAVQAQEIRVVRLSEDQIKKLLSILIPKTKDQEKFMAILKCENGTHQPDRVNVNKDGSIDLGLSQINNRWHKKRVEEMFNQSFEEAMKNPVNNLVYAAYLYQKSGNFHLWACDGLVNEK